MPEKHKDDVVIISFPTRAKWEQWLAGNHSKQDGIWLKFFKKGSGVKSITYDEALDIALCYGWIDGLLNRYDDKAYLQKFTPRRKNSMWSKRNRGHAERLIKEGRMREPGLVQIELAKKDGRWEKAYDSQSGMKVPDDFLDELSKYKKAKTFFDKLDKANKYSIGWRLQTAKTPTARNKKMKEIIEMLKAGKKFHEVQIRVQNPDKRKKK